MKPYTKAELDIINLNLDVITASDGSASTTPEPAASTTHIIQDPTTTWISPVMTQAVPLVPGSVIRLPF